MFNFGKTYKYLDMLNPVLDNGEKKYWDIKKALSYGRAVIICTGQRNIGKSTQTAILCLLTYAIYGKKFVYCRRRKTDVDDTYKTFFNNAIELFNRVYPRKIINFRAYNGSYWVAFTLDENEEPVWEECGRYIPLSMEENFKSNSFSEYVILVYDEFISKRADRYLGTKENTDVEWSSLVSLCQTIDRGIDCPFREELTLFCLGNKSTVYNPIALSLGLVDYVQPGATYTAPKGLDWLWEDIDCVGATKDVENCVWYRVSTEKDKDYAYRNKGADSNEYIKRADKALYIHTVQIHGERYGIYTDYTNFYIDTPMNCHMVKSLDLYSHTSSDTGLIKAWRNDDLMMQLTEAFADNRLYFGNGKIKHIFLKYLEFTK